MGRNDADRSLVDGDIDVECASGLARWNTQIDTAGREDWVAREERDAVSAARTDKRCAGHNLEPRHGRKKLNLVGGIRVCSVRVQFLEPNDIGTDLAYYPGHTGCVVPSVGTDTAVDVVGSNHKT
jgi:hypothetical protein